MNKQAKQSMPCGCNWVKFWREQNRCSLQVWTGLKGSSSLTRSVCAGAVHGGELMRSCHGMGQVAGLASRHSRLMQRLCCLLRQAQHLEHCLPQSKQRLLKLILVACTCVLTTWVSRSVPCLRTLLNVKDLANWAEHAGFLSI